MAQSTNLGLHWTILKSWYIYIYTHIFILWNSPQMVSSGIVYYWVYHIRNFVLRNFCHLSSSHGPGLVTRPICTSRVWSMLVTAWPWHVGTSMWLTKSAAPMVTRKCWLYLLVKRIVIGCNLQFQTSGRDSLWFEMFRRPSTLKQFCILNYISMRQINTSIYFTVSQCLSHSAALLDQDGFESKTSNTSCIMPCPPASATSCHITEEMSEVPLTNMNPCNTGLVEVFHPTSQARFCQQGMAFTNQLIGQNFKEQMDVE